jgi:hypothetical protein
MKTPWFTFSSALAALLIVSTAEAQSTDGRVRLGFDFSFVGLDVRSAELDGGGPSDDTVQVSSGFAFDNTFLNAGYGLSEVLTLGIRARTGSVATMFTDRDSDPTETSYHLTGLPYLEVNLGDGGTVQPFIGPTLGLDLTVREARTDSSGDPDFQSADVSFLFGALFGLRIFVNETLAIEPTLVATYGVGGFSDETAGGPELDGTTKEFSLMLLFGASAWLGAERAKERPAPESNVTPGAYEPTPYPDPAREPAPAAAPPPPAQPAPVDAPTTSAPAPEAVPPAPPPPASAPAPTP